MRDRLNKQLEIVRGAMDAAKGHTPQSRLDWAAAMLGVARTPTQADLKRAYKERSMQTHPDKAGSSERMQQVNEAYQYLKSFIA